MRVLWIGILFVLGCASNPIHFTQNPTPLIRPEERYFGRIKQITFTGKNLRPNWSSDGRYLTFEHQELGSCNAVYQVRADGSEIQQVSKSFAVYPTFIPGKHHFLYSATGNSPGENKTCPATTDEFPSWAFLSSLKIYSAKPGSNDLFLAEPSAPTAYSAETQTCSNGKVVFTSTRDGDAEIYLTQLGPLEGFTEVQTVTQNLGYDGQARFSPDCQWLTWASSHLSQDKTEFRPENLEIWTAPVNGQAPRQVTQMRAISLSPAFTPDGKSILFSSNYPHPRGRVFNLFKIKTDGTGLEQITFANGFDAFPTFSSDGRFLAFTSRRNFPDPQIFVAEWNAEAGTRYLPIESEKIRENISQPPRSFADDVPSLKILSDSPRIYALPCSLKKDWILLASTQDHPAQNAALLETARILARTKSGNACFAFSIGDGALKTKKISIKAALFFGSIEKMTANQIQITGTSTSAVWREILNEACEKTALDCVPTNEAPFIAEKIPSLVFFNPPSLGDLNYTGIHQTAELLARIAQKVHAAPRVEFTKSTDLEAHDSRPSGAYLGTVPDYSEMHNQNIVGVKLAEASPGSPAENAGVKVGDILRRVTFLDKDLKPLRNLEIQNLQDFSNALQEIRPGHKVRLTVIRSQKEIELDATIGSRK